jgi:kinesin family protein 3/17
MEGKREGPPQLDDMRGIIPRTFDQIFESIATEQNSSKKFLVAISYVEIYSQTRMHLGCASHVRPSREKWIAVAVSVAPHSHAAACYPCVCVCLCPDEEVRDLLSDNPKQKMDVKEDPDKGVFIKGLSQPEVTSVAQIDQLMLKGNSQRSIGATAMNATSSRSHSLFTVRIETSTKVEGSDDEHIKAGKLNLVDCEQIIALRTPRAALVACVRRVLAEHSARGRFTH